MKHLIPLVLAAVTSSCVTNVRPPIKDTAQFSVKEGETVGFFAAKVILSEKISPKNRGWSFSLNAVSTDGQKNQTVLFRRLRNTKKEHNAIFALPVGQYKVEEMIVRFDKYNLPDGSYFPESRLKVSFKNPFKLNIQQNQASFLGDLSIDVENVIDLDKGRRGQSSSSLGVQVQPYMEYPAKEWKAKFEDLKISKVVETSTGEEMKAK